jgi:pectin methylesterase-like acyl-CoA thioesterase
MTRKRKVYLPPKRSSKGPAPVYVAPVTPPTVAVINMKAGMGRGEIVVGMRVTILGTGLYAGETAIVESLVGGVIPAAMVRTEADRTRRVRTIDLAPAARPVAQAQAAAAASADPAGG